MYFFCEKEFTCDGLKLKIPMCIIGREVYRGGGTVTAAQPPIQKGNKLNAHKNRLLQQLLRTEETKRLFIAGHFLSWQCLPTEDANAFNVYKLRCGDT